MSVTTNEFPPLYSRSSTGAVLVWSIEVDGNKFRTVSGQLHGQKVTSEWTVTNVKNAGRANATTAEEQAVYEAKSRHKKKIDSGYKLNQADIDIQLFTEPMLAHKWDDYGDEVTFPVVCQPKLDGVRCIARKDGLWSRNGKKFYPWPHIVDLLAPLFEKYPDAILDGEWYNPAFHDDFNKIVSLVKKAKPTPADVEEAAAKLQYHVYDCPSGFGGIRARLNELSLKLVLSGITPFSGCPLKMVATHDALDIAELDHFEAQYLAAGYEGQMVRTAADPYEFKRSKSLLKRKRFQDGEFKILAVTEGSGNKTGWAASMSFKMPDGKPFNSNVKGPEDYLKRLWQMRADLIGQLATVRYFNLTPDGVPRFPYVVSIARNEVEGASRDSN